MTANLDTSKGWCCDGRTWTEHAHADGECCQPQGQEIDQLPPEGQKKARERLDTAGSEGEAMTDVRNAGAADAHLMKGWPEEAREPPSS